MKRPAVLKLDDAALGHAFRVWFRGQKFSDAGAWCPVREVPVIASVLRDIDNHSREKGLIP